ncbi:hypothetical protein A5821_003470 [Enterococcus sp. 7F3_DIV0205]|uniref:Lipoprotein n=1 Tax=Candidatus Enterococcus palustris TaxID=1834189 RepID=A0AAQ3WBW7_9ENTE|nr:hypothetical protein [Enterococcus sp. 7F3_DIV0205]OTN84352.1 hypothetical protein A5821_000278 [Enterococcus sp. 7F3_DIV0205]
MKKATAIIICMTGILLLGGCTNSKTNKETKANPEETQALFEKADTTLSSLEKEIDASYTDNTKEAIKKDITLAKVSEFEQELKDLPKDDFTSIEEKEKVTAYTTRKKEVTEELPALREKITNLSAKDIITRFQSEGLTVHYVQEMKKPQDFGAAPTYAKSAYIFGVEEDPFYADSEDLMDKYKNARVMTFEKIDDLNKTKSYYDELGQQSGILYSHTFGNDARFFLIQMNGDIPQETFDLYKNSLAEWK